MSQPPNIVLITTDQQRWDSLQCAGNKKIWTPHLDWLADSGIRFSRAYTDCPVCQPARTTMISGRHAYHHRVMSNRWVDGAATPQSSLAGHLGRAGYQTRLVGKTHFGPGRSYQGFDHIEGFDDYQRWVCAQSEGGNSHPSGLGNNENAPGINPLPTRLASNAWVVDRGLDFFQTRDDTRPYFLWLSFHHPHPPYTPTRDYWELYRDRPMPERVLGDWSMRKRDIPPAFTAVTRELSMTQRLDANQIAQLRRAYYGCISEVDYQLGRLFGDLAQRQMLDHTWIIFTTDHGEMLGDHHLGGKCVPFDAAARIPFLVRPPAAPRDVDHSWRGSVCDDLVCLADIMPTCLAAAGAPIPEGLDGQDLGGVLDGRPPQRDDFFISCMYMHAVVRNGWKLCRETLDDRELLFNVDQDPYEQRNRLDDPDCRDVLGDLRCRLDRHIATNDLQAAGANDPGVLKATDLLPSNTHPGMVSGRSLT